MPPIGNVIRWGNETARTCAWRADGSVALLVPVPEGAVPSAAFLRRCLVHLGQQGYQRVITGALAAHEREGFLEAGFSVHENLHLLLLSASGTPPAVPPGPRLHRAGPRRRRQLLEVDASAFSPFWRLDRQGLAEALNATARHRLRVVLGRRGPVVGYAICGTSRGRGFVQRLAVAPEAQGRGLGKRLLADGVAWMYRAGAKEVAVNTQAGNQAALRLYLSHGFREGPEGLAVLCADLPGASARPVP